MNKYYILRYKYGTKPEVPLGEKLENNKPNNIAHSKITDSILMYYCIDYDRKPDKNYKI